MELVIKGDAFRVKRLAKELKIRAKRDGLTMSLPKVNKTETAKNIEVVDDVEVKKPSKKGNSKKDKK